MDASELEQENLKMHRSKVNSQGRLSSYGGLEEGVLEAAHEKDFIVNESVSQVQVGDDNEVEEFEIGASYEDYKVKPPEYWLTVLTEYNCLVLKKNLTKQIGFAKACVGRHAGDVLRSGKLQLHIDKIEPANDLNLMLHSKNGPAPTYAAIKKVAVKCEEQKVNFPRRHTLLILGLYVKDVVQSVLQHFETTDCQEFYEHWTPLWGAKSVRSHAPEVAGPGRRPREQLRRRIQHPVHGHYAAITQSRPPEIRHDVATTGFDNHKRFEALEQRRRRRTECDREHATPLRTCGWGYHSRTHQRQSYKSC
jgi:hypothetical protein